MLFYIPASRRWEECGLSMTPSDDLGTWQDVPIDLVRTWRGLFDASAEGLDLAADCPVCRSRSLHRWFNLAKAEALIHAGRAWQGSGSQWQWCSTCRSYEHSRSLIPDWWIAPFDIDLAVLAHNPAAIEHRRLELRL
jgi:hypothetical protein